MVLKVVSRKKFSQGVLELQQASPTSGDGKSQMPEAQ